MGIEVDKHTKNVYFFLYAMCILLLLEFGHGMFRTCKQIRGRSMESDEKKLFMINGMRSFGLSESTNKLSVKKYGNKNVELFLFIFISCQKSISHQRDVIIIVIKMLHLPCVYKLVV